MSVVPFCYVSGVDRFFRLLDCTMVCQLYFSLDTGCEGDLHFFEYYLRASSYENGRQRDKVHLHEATFPARVAGHMLSQ